MVDVNTWRAIRLIVTLSAGVAAGKQIFWDKIQSALFNGPVVENVQVLLEPTAPGEQGRLILSFDKTRPCKFKSSALVVTDAEGVSHPVTNSLSEVDLPVAEGQRLLLLYTAPPFAKAGMVKAGEFEWGHERCSDGPDPLEPVRVKIEPFTILKAGEARRTPHP